MNLSRHQPLSEIVLIVGAPLVLAVVECFHPQREPGVSLEGNVIGRWLRR